MEASADTVVSQLARIAFASMGDYLTSGPDGIRLKPLDQLDPDQRAAIAELRVDEHGCVRLKLHDKIQALDKLARHLGMFKERLQLTGKDDEPLVPLELLRKLVAEG